MKQSAGQIDYLIESMCIYKYNFHFIKFCLCLPGVRTGSIWTQ